MRLKKSFRRIFKSFDGVVVFRPYRWLMLLKSQD